MHAITILDVTMDAAMHGHALYRPLSAQAAEIRILELLPGAGPIVCRLHNRFVEASHFEALSYAWTEQTIDDPTININGHTVKVRQSLADALHRFRRRDVSRNMWIDAVCINQADALEKNLQVLLMRDIYAASQRTLIWLGPADASTAEGFALARLRARKARQDAAYEDDEMPKTVGVFWTGFFENKQWYALSNLHTRDWFRRAWIVQEVTVASRATVFCGEHEMEWVDLVVGNQDIQFASSYLRRLGGGATKDSQQMQQEDLTAVLARNRQRQATLPADKIYAFLGLVDDDKRYGILPDYNRSEEDLLLHLTLDSIATRGDLGIFSASTHRALAERSRPSWVFSNSYDASRDTLASESFAWKAHMWGGSYFPTFDACSGTNARPVYNEKEQSLTLQGMVFDVVVEVGNHRKGYRQVIVNDYLNVLRKWPEKVTEYICYLNWRRVSRISEADDKPCRECVRQTFWETTYGGVLDRYRDQAKRDWEFIDGALEPLLQLPKWLLEYRPFIHVVCIWFLLQGLLLQALGMSYLIPFSRFSTNTTASYNRRLLRTKRGAIGLGPNTTRVGDCVTILEGGKVPIILREVSSLRWTLVGESYVHGIMQGEAFDSKQSRPFVLI